MTITVAKQNAGSPRTYGTVSRLSSALMRVGARAVQVHFEGGKSSVTVEWPEGEVTYPMDRHGNVDPQLAWDMDPAVKS